MHKRLHFLFIVALGILSFENALGAYTYTAIASADWSVNTTWSSVPAGGTIPGAADAVVIPAGKHVTINTAGEFANTVTINNGGQIIMGLGATALTITAGGSITISSGGQLIESGASTDGVTFAAGAGTSTFTNAGTVDIEGALTVNSSATFSGAGTFTIGRLTPATNSITVTINNTITGSSTQNHPCTINNTGVTITGTGTLDLSACSGGSINADANTLTIGCTVKLGKDFVMNGGASITCTIASGGNVSAPSNIRLGASVLCDNDILNINSGGTLTTTNAIEIDQTGLGLAGFTINNSGTVSVGTDIELFDATGIVFSNTGTFTLTGTNTETTGSGTFTNNAGSTLNLAAAGLPLNASLPLTCSANSNTVNYTSGSAQTIINPAANTYYNLTISGGQTASLAATEIVTSNVDISSGTLAAGANSLSVGGNWTNSGSYTVTTGSVTFNSSTAAQTLTGATTFYNLTMNNTFAIGSLTLNSAVTVTNALTLTSKNIITTATNLLTLNAGATSTSGSASSFIQGPMAKVGTTAFVFPVGNNSVWARIAIGTPTASETFTAQYFNSGYGTYTISGASVPSLHNVSSVEYWTLGRAGAANATVTLYSEDCAASGISLCSNTDLRVAHFNTVTSKWENNNTTGTVVNLTAGTCGAATGKVNVVSGGNVTNFSPFTFGSLAGTNPLPITLISFTGSYDNESGIATLNWTTSSEINNKQFFIRRSTDGINWTTIDTIAGAGNSDVTLNYSATDMNPPAGLVYYRLEQQDFDGNTVGFNAIVLNIAWSSIVKIFPNPSNRIVYVQGNNIKTINVIDLSGQLVLNTTISGNQSYINVSSLADGLYIIEAIDNMDRPYRMKFTKK